MLYLNKRLFIFGKTDTKLCSFCNLEDEATVHLFANCTKTNTFWLTFIIFQWKFKTSFTESTVCHFWFFRYQSRYIFSFKSYFIIIQAFYFYWVGGWVTLCEITVFFTLSSCNYVYIASCFLFIPVRQLHGQSRQWGP